MAQTSLITQAEADSTDLAVEQVQVALDTHKDLDWSATHGPITAIVGNYTDSAGEIVGSHTLRLTVGTAQYYVPCRIWVEPSPAADLNGMRWELPCTADANTTTCKCVSSPVVKKAQIFGTGSYNIRLKFRGAVEVTTYQGGTQSSRLYTLTDPNMSTTDAVALSDRLRNTFCLEISSPHQKYFLNASTGGDLTGVKSIDFAHTFTMDAGAIVTITSRSVDGLQAKNSSNIQFPASTFESVALPKADALANASKGNGEYLQMNVI